MTKTKEKIDWQQIHERLAVNRDALDRAFVLDKQGMQERMRQRAQMLARRGIENRHDTATRKVLVFERDGQRLALDLSHVVQIVKLADCTPVPGSDNSLVGVANFDGEVRCVMDLNPLFARSPFEGKADACVILTKWERLELGILANQVEETAEFHEDEICQPEETSAEHLGVSYGIGPLQTVLLDVEKLFAAFASCSSVN